MKSIVLILSLCANSAFAGIASDDEILPKQVKPYLQERFQFRTTLLLDWATFGRRELSRLELDTRIHWAASANHLMSAYKLDATREGTMVLIIVEGTAEEMLRFFNTLLNHNIVSLVHVKTRILTQTSDE